MTYTGNESIYPIIDGTIGSIGDTLYSKTLREFMYSIVSGIYSSNEMIRSIIYSAEQQGFKGSLADYIALNADQLTKAYLDQLNKNQQP